MKLGVGISNHFSFSYEYKLYRHVLQYYRHTQLPIVDSEVSVREREGNAVIVGAKDGSQEGFNLELVCAHVQEVQRILIIRD